jgi:hypothetical protein
MGVDMSSNEDCEVISKSANWLADAVSMGPSIAYLSDCNRPYLE